MLKENKFFSQFGFLNRIHNDNVVFLDLNKKRESQINFFDVYSDNLKITDTIIKPFSILSIDENGNEHIEEMNETDFLKLLDQTNSSTLNI